MNNQSIGWFLDELPLGTNNIMRVFYYILLFYPTMAFSQVNPYNCDYESAGFLEDYNTVEVERYIKFINSVSKKCLQNDLEYSAWINKLLFKHLEDSNKFNLVIESISLSDSIKFDLLKKFVMLRPLLETYNYERIIININRRLDIEENQYVNHVLKELRSRYLCLTR